VAACCSVSDSRLLSTTSQSHNSDSHCWLLDWQNWAEGDADSTCGCVVVTLKPKDRVVKNKQTDRQTDTVLANPFTHSVTVLFEGSDSISKMKFPDCVWHYSVTHMRCKY